jgi:predicted nucleotide-binding protein
MYALGVRHVIGHPVIHLISHEDTLPFDVANAPAIIYDLTSAAGTVPAREALSSALKAVEDEAFPSSSPVTAAFDVGRLEYLRQSLEARPADVNGAILNAIQTLDHRLASIEQMLPSTPREPAKGPEFSRRIFVVHGHDTGLKNELARFLEKLDFEPVILHEQPDRGKTIFGKLDSEMRDVGFAIVILTPDDVGALVTERETLRERARQNVVFEHGLFAGYLSPHRVCAIQRGHVELPSDLHGLVYKTIPLDGGVASIALELANELKAAGYIVDANRLLTV